MSTQETRETYLANYRRRFVQQALSEALGVYWRRRAESLLAAVSRPGDYRGAATPDEVAARDERLRADAVRCLDHAQLLERSDAFADDVISVLAEVC